MFLFDPDDETWGKILWVHLQPLWCTAGNKSWTSICQSERELSLWGIHSDWIWGVSEFGGTAGTDLLHWSTLIALLQLMPLLIWHDNLRMQSEETDVPPPQHASLSALPIPPLFSIYPATCFSTCNMMATPSSISGSCFSAYTCTSATCVCPGNRGSPQPWLGKH